MNLDIMRLSKFTNRGVAGESVGIVILLPE